MVLRGDMPALADRARGGVARDARSWSCWRPILTPGCLDHADKTRCRRDALADGVATAKALRARFPDLAPQEIARELGVPIEAIDDDPAVGSIWRFAEYRQRPARILLYDAGSRRSIARLSATWPCDCSGRQRRRMSLSRTSCSIISRRPDRRPRSRGATGRRLFRIGGWHWRTGIAALAEIAAGAFAQVAARSALSSPPARSGRTRCHFLPPARRSSPGVSSPPSGGIDLSFLRLCPYNRDMAHSPSAEARRRRISG